ncbi:MAG: S9 family peptidase [Muribaculaceae bacterium]|nr:S9 family peptidase [Muribaculaceae bacterium]
MNIRYMALAALSIFAAVPSVCAQRSNAVAELAAYTAPANRPSAPESYSYLPDGTALSLAADGRSIVRVDVRTGKAGEPLLDLGHTREVTIPDIEGFVVSPDGGQILVWRDSRPIYRRSFEASYYVYEVRSRLLRPLSAEHALTQSPVFSPDSRMVAFVASNNIYVKKLDYNTEVAVTTDGLKNSVINGVPDWTYEEEFTTACSMAWAPDALTLCYLRYDESAVPMYSFPLYEGTCDPRTQYALYPGTYSYKYPVAGAVNSKVTLHSYDIETRKTKQLDIKAPGVEYIPRIGYGDTAERLVVATLNRDQNRLEIFAVNPKSTVARSIYVEESNAWIAPETYEQLHLGSKSMVVLSSRSGFAQLYEYSYTGTQLRQLTSGDKDITAYYGADARGSHYYQAAAPTPLDRTVCAVDAKGVVRTLSPSAGTASAEFTPAMDMAVMCHSTATTPPVYTLVNASGKALRTIEDNAAYAARCASMPVREFFEMRAGDGTMLNGYVMRPADAQPGRRYPVVMTQYSGPGSQSVLNRWSLDWEQYFAANGYVVVCVDGRGTGGRGRAFSDVVYRNLGHYETIDQLAAARYAASLPYADASRIAIYGWSYGGYEALMCASADGAPYAAAVAVAPVTDWRYYDTVYAERYMLTPQQNAEGYRASAPLTRASRLACPLLIMSGTADDNVHMFNTMQYVSALQSAGILCDMLIFPNMNHSINGCNARAVVYAKMLDYLNRVMK